ncbi:MAG: EAL domain-containing protein [Pseudomonadota bacterium]
MLAVADTQLWSHLAAGLLVAAMAAWLAWIVRAGRRRAKRARSLLTLQGAAMESAMDAILIADRAGRLVWCNRAFERLTGWSAADAVGRGARRLLQGDRTAEEPLRRLRECVAAGRPWRGEVELSRRDGGAIVADVTVTPVREDGGADGHYVAVLSDVTERRRAEERIHFLSSYDPLTSLPNRLLFHDRLERAVARATTENQTLAVLFLDLDDFSRVNDLMGHDCGDRLLVVVVDRLLAAAAGVELVARLGGDEFGLLLSADATADAAARTAQAVIEAVTRPYDVDGHAVHLGASVGITLFPGDGADARVLMKNADVAMYRALRETPGGFRFFSATMDSELAARRKLENDLRRAVARGELELLYQPIVATGSRRIIGLEALLRWNRDGTVVLPDEFIALAEETGVIGPIGEWALAEACRQSRLWSEDGLPAVPVAVNVSAVQMRGDGFVERLRDTLRVARLPAGRLEIELTESAVLDDPEQAERRLAAIKELGVRVAVDDFGTGYSSLARLKRFPVDKLKIDKSFVADLESNADDAAIARAVVSLAHGLGIQVVSEGVETEGQLRYLEEEGCDAVQGYLFSAPVGAARATELLRKGGFPA